jgi:hypothetical protein
MIFGTTPFASAPFSALLLPANNIYVGVEGFSLSLALRGVQVTTAGNINVDVDVVGNSLTVNTGSVVSWIDITDGATNVWTEIIT